MGPNPRYPGPPAGAPPAGGTPGLAVAAFVLSLVGACGPCLGLLGIALAVAALAKINKTPGLGGRGLALAALILPLVYIPAEILLAIPNFQRFQARSKQVECKANLKQLYIAERAYFVQKQAFSTSVEEVGFVPERGNRYAYFLFDAGQLEDRSSAEPASSPGNTGVGVDTFKYKRMRPVTYGDLPPLDVKAGVHGQCPRCSFVAICAANLDGDETLDVWSISTESRTSPEGEGIPAGLPFNHVNDAKQ